MVEDHHVVERAPELLADGRAALLGAVLPDRDEAGLEEADKQAGDRRVGTEHPLQVDLAELGARPVAGPRVRAQQRDLAPGQPGVEHQAVEVVVLGLAAPDRPEVDSKPVQAAVTSAAGAARSGSDAG